MWVMCVCISTDGVLCCSKIYGFQKYEVLLFFAMLFKTYFMRLLNEYNFFYSVIVWNRERLKAKGKNLFGKNVYAANKYKLFRLRPE